jgi:tRNA-specific 2-thiouridylase
MVALAERLGAARLATGHYARLTSDASGPLVRGAADPAKDQAYMLARLSPALLDRLDFPLGELTKPRVRSIARAARLPVADRAESQDLCFLAGTSGADFLARHGGRARPGDVVDLAGRRLGTHAGQHLFTVGQRRGLGVAAGEPLYVIRKDPRRGRIVVGPRSALDLTRIEIGGATLHRAAAEVDTVKLRYRSRPVRTRVEEDAGPGRHPRLTLNLAEPVQGVAPGQVACLMRGDEVVGAATIRAQSPAKEEPVAV